MDAASNLFDAYKKAESMIAAGQLREAADLCKEMLDANPDYAYGYHLMASLFSATGTFERAVTFSQMATQLGPDVCAFHIQHGQLLYSLGEYESAAVSFLAAFEIEPENVIPLLLLASTFTGRGMYREAQSLLTRARTLSDLPEIDEQEGLFHLQQGNRKDAEEFFDRLTTRCPHYLWGHVYKGRVLMENSQNVQANAHAEASMARALRIDPACFEALFALAVLNDRQGQPEIAIRYAMEAIKAKPLGVECHRFLAALLLRERHYAEAQQLLAQSLSIRPNDAYALQMLYQALCHLGRDPEFQKYIEKQLTRHEAHPLLLHFLAMSENRTPPGAPLAYAQSYYDGFSTQYDYYQQDVMSYKAPQTAAITLKQWQESHSRKSGTLLDLGCGTGFAAAAMQDMVDTCTGVDCSPQILTKARGKKIYDQLYLDDMTAFMLQSTKRYDVVIAIDSLCHTGDLLPFLRAARNVVSQNGALLFTTEKDFQADTYRLSASGRYTHATKYVHSALEEKGFALIQQQDFTLYIDNTLAASGQLWLAQKMQTH